MDELPTLTQPSLTGADDRRPSFLVVEGDSSFLVPLPAHGEVIIGRGEEAQVRLATAAVSREHARVRLAETGATLIDLESHNGTRLNGDWVRTPRELFSGDTISICGCELTFRSGGKRGPRTVSDASGFRARLTEEVERAIAYQRPLALLDIATPQASAELLLAVAAALRPIDVLARGGEGELLILLPEMNAERAERAAQALLERLGPLALECRVGVSLLPRDGADAEGLILSSRAAAASAKVGALAHASEAARRLVFGGEEVLLADPGMLRIYDLLERLARSELAVLIAGETGTGKEHAARALHDWSARAGGPFVAFNGAALPDALLESELFGHQKGAFTGATSARKGLLESASGGTLFLDEVGELSASAQAKLLRALETRMVRPLGSTVERPIDLRLVVATNRDLDEESAAGRFRRDLFFRLAAARVVLLPLRQRSREIPLLANAFLARTHEQRGHGPERIAGAAMRSLEDYAWPGNVRELKNAIEFGAASAGEEPSLERRHLPALLRGEETEAPGTWSSTVGTSYAEARERALEEFEERFIGALLARHGGSAKEAARAADIDLKYLYKLIKRHGLKS